MRGFKKAQELHLENMKRVEDVMCLINELKSHMTDFEEKNAPKDPTPEEERSVAKMKMWELRLKIYLEREELAVGNMHKIYRIVLGQCTLALRSTLKGDKDYAEKSASYDAVWLLTVIKTVTAGVDLKANPALTLHEQMLLFSTTHQGQSESDDDYLVRFDARFQNMEMAGGEHLMISPQLLNKKLEDGSPDKIEKERERFKAMCFIL